MHTLLPGTTKHPAKTSPPVKSDPAHGPRAPAKRSSLPPPRHARPPPPPRVPCCARNAVPPTVREATTMSTSFRKARKRTAALFAAASLLLLGQQVLTPVAAEAAATFTDDFNGPAGSAVDGSKWQLEPGDNVNNHERQYYTSGTNNAQLDGQGHLVITA